MLTPHISAQPGDFAETILMPGDPLRAQYIAEKWLDEVQEVTNVRGMLGFTGFYQGTRLSVMGHGMGIPSACIYLTELIKEYGVKHIIRVGSCGGIHPDLTLHDIVIAIGASTDSKVNRMRFNDHDFAAIADFTLVQAAVQSAHKLGLMVHMGNIFSTDLFYPAQPQMLDVMRKLGILAVEMEAAGIYGVAAELGAKALTICAVSNHLLTGEELDPLERQIGFDRMIELSLDTALQLG
jgi:purine-nucleoside phosphorylase